MADVDKVQLWLFCEVVGQPMKRAAEEEEREEEAREERVGLG